MTSPNAGFREIEHTADWELEVWAPDLTTLLALAAKGMQALSGIRLLLKERVKRQLSLSAADAESLLVAFLSELLFIAETEAVVFDRFDLKLHGFQLEADLEGAPIAGMDKEIKAVTYHNLRVISGPDGMRVNIVFDV